MINLKIKRALPTVICILLLIAAVAAAGIGKQAAQKETNTAKSETQETAKGEKPKKTEEMRGVWVTYFELNMAGEADKSEKAFRNKFEKTAQRAKNLGFNTLIVQVRPFCDALYESQYFPYSHILSGTQGKSPGYDALKIMCEICKSKSLKIHAWINPYRVKLNETPKELSEDNPYFYDESVCIETDSQIILDPSNEEARKLIINGIDEIVSNYDVDGIQFDDYFYPSDIGDNDSEQYNEYLKSAAGGNAMILEEWRKYNVNLLVSQAYMTVHGKNKGLVFGISPQGNLKNNDRLAADVISWCCAEGFLDYICPQIYFSLDNPKLGFEESLKEWCELDFSESVKLYVGLAGYKAASDADDGTWLESDTILADEYKIIQKYQKVSGIMLYSSVNLDEDDKKAEIENLTKLFK